MSMKLLPLVHAMVLCDEVAADAVDLTTHLTGVRSHIVANEFPYMRERLCVYLELSRSAGESLANIICIKQAENEKETFATPLRRIKFLGPLVIVSIMFRIEDMPFPSPGTYYLQFFCDEQLVTEHRLTLIQGDIS